MARINKQKDWGKIAKKFEEKVRYIGGLQIISRISELVQSERNLGLVLELGCGTGFFTRLIAPQALKVCALDISPDMIEVCRINLGRFNNVDFKTADCRASGLTDSAFDTVFMGNLLHVVEDPVAILREALRLLKPEGRVIAVDYTGYGMAKIEKLKLIFRYLKAFGRPPKAGKSNLTPESFEQFSRIFNLKIGKNELLVTRTMRTVYFSGSKK